MSTSLKIAVTGGSGHIGRAVVKHLVERGHQVWNLDRQQSPDRLARFIYVDLGQREQVQPIFEQVDAVCHLGEIANVRLGGPDQVYSTNTRIGATVLQTAADLQMKRFVYCSSCQVYGVWGEGDSLVAPRYLPVDEAHPHQPQNAYALAKSANERYAELVAARNGLSVAAVRLPWVMRGSDDGNWDRFVGWMINGNNDPREGLCTYISVTDAARAFALVLENPRPGFEAYHFTAAEVFSGKPIRQRLLETFPDYPPLPVDWPKFKAPVSLEKARQHFGWEPEFSLLDVYRKKHGRDPE
jgi:nucleoside-diphosphate-sugar epimerase